MEKVDEHLNRFLPYGSSLQYILNHPSIKKSDIRQLLRLKGIFMDDVDNENTFPLLTTVLLSPSEFDFLKERLQSREDRQKVITRTLDWNSKSTLFEALPDNFNIQEIIKSAFPTYKVMGNPDFAMVDSDPNNLLLKFKCETHNYDQAWFRVKNEFDGEVAIRKVVSNDNQVQLQIIHTSPETSEVSNKVVNRLEKHFKQSGHMESAKSIKAITFGDFTNEERMAFFLSLTDGNDTFEFKKSLRLDIGPDETQQLPSNINWMELGKVRDLEITGEVLHEIDFIRDSSMHQFLEAATMELEFDFHYPAAEGRCRISFGFHSYFRKKLSSTEFVVDVSKVVLDDAYATIPLNRVQRHLLDEFEKFKTEKYNWIKYQALSNQYTP